MVYAPAVFKAVPSVDRSPPSSQLLSREVKTRRARSDGAKRISVSVRSSKCGVARQ